MGILLSRNNRSFIMNQTIIHSILVGGLLAASLQAEAAGFNKFDNGNGKVMSSTRFYQVLAETKPDQIAAKFGFPDQMQTIKNSTMHTLCLSMVK
jgi:hypothetical protein